MLIEHRPYASHVEYQFNNIILLSLMKRWWSREADDCYEVCKKSILRSAINYIPSNAPYVIIGWHKAA